jgi:hypothetical protein
MFFYARGTDLNAPRSGMAGRDGYTVMAKADRQTGIRPVVGGAYDPALRADLD